MELLDLAKHFYCIQIVLTIIGKSNKNCMLVNIAKVVTQSSYQCLVTGKETKNHQNNKVKFTFNF